MEYAHYLHNFHSVSCQKNRAESLAARDAKWNKSSAAMPSRCAKNKRGGGGHPTAAPRILVTTSESQLFR